MQWLAMLTMLVDHVGIVFFPGNEALRLIGRIAFPLYAYLLVIGYTRTRDSHKYLVRMMVLAVVSQIPFMLAFDTVAFNAIATLTVCLAVLSIMDAVLGVWRQVLTVLLALPALDLLSFDYGAYALLMVLMFRYTPKSAWVIIHLVLNLVFMFWKGWTLQSFSIIATLLLIGVSSWTDRRVPGWLWRSFYPAHLTTIAIILIVGR